MAAGDEVFVGRIGVFARRLGVAADEVVAVDVVDVAVAVVVDPVAGDLAGVLPGDRIEVGAVEAVAGVDVGDDRGRRAEGVGPGVERVDVVAGDRAGEALDPGAGVVECPLLGEERIVRNRRRCAEGVRFSDRDGGVGAQFGDRAGDRLARFDRDQLEARSAEVGLVVDFGFGAGAGLLGAIGSRFPLDDDAAGHRACRRGRRSGGFGLRESGSGRQRDEQCGRDRQHLLGARPRRLEVSSQLLKSSPGDRGAPRAAASASLRRGQSLEWALALSRGPPASPGNDNDLGDLPV